MSDAYTTLNPGLNGTNIDETGLTYPTNPTDRRRQRIILAGENIDELVDVTDTDAPADSFGLVVRNIPSGIQEVSGSLTTSPSGTQAVSGTITSVQSGTYAVSGSVTNIPSGTQAVSGTVTTVPSGTQPVSGTITSVQSGTYAVSGTTTAIPTGTQAVSGIVTANQGTASAPGTAWPVNPVDANFNAFASATANPSGTEVALVTRNIPSGTQNVAGSVSLSGTITSIPSGTQPVSGTITAVQSGTYAVSGTVTNVPSGTQTTSDLADGPVTPGAVATKSILGGMQYNTAAPAPTNGQQLAFQSDSAGNLKVAGSLTTSPSGTQAVSGTVTSVQSGTYAVSGTVTTVPTGTQTVSGSLTAIPTGTQIITGVVTANQGGTAAPGGYWAVLPVDGNGDDMIDTQAPASTAWGLITRNIPTGTQAVSGSFTAVPSGTQPVSGTVTSVQSGTYAVSGTIATNADGSVTPGTVGTKSILGGMQYNTSAPAPTDGQQLAFQSDSAGNLKVAGSLTTTPSGTQAVSGTVTAVPTGTQVVSGTITNVPSGTQPVSGTITSVQSGTYAVSGTVTNVPSGTQTIGGTVTANAGTGTFTVGGTVTNVPSGTQTIAAGIALEVTGSTTTTGNLFSQDVSGYRWISVQITTQGTSSTVNFECSNDNTNWVNSPLMASNIIYNSTAPGPVNSTTATGVFHGPTVGKYFRARVSGIASGTTAATTEFFASVAQSL